MKWNRLENFRQDLPLQLLSIAAWLLINRNVAIRFRQDPIAIVPQQWHFSYTQVL